MSKVTSSRWSWWCASHAVPDSQLDRFFFNIFETGFDRLGNWILGVCCGYWGAYFERSGKRFHYGEMKTKEGLLDGKMDEGAYGTEFG